MKLARVTSGLGDSETSFFLNALFAGKPDELYLLIWTRQGERKRSSWFRDVQQAAAFVDSLHGCNVYVGIGLSPSDFGEFNRCKSDDVAGIIGLGVDIDMKSDAHPKGARPETIEQALSILPPELPPSIIVETGNGIQVWWLLKEPWIFDNAAERQQAATLLSRWQTLLNYAAQRCGWAFERLGDLARVLRAFGTRNVKEPSNPKNVTIRNFAEHRYNPSDFREYLDDLAIPDEEEKARSVKALLGRSGDTSIVINLGVTVADEQLARWIKQDPRFEKTWNHQRTDMQDVSQSGYDQALAWFGVQNGLTDQQIVDLIVQNRRLHGAKQSKSLDYYRQAISKARNGNGARKTNADEMVAGGIPEKCDNTGDAADPHAKARRCEQISEVLGVQILRIVKLAGQDPIYFMELETGTIQFPDAGKFISQSFVKTVIAAAAGKVLPRFRPTEWDRLTQMMLDACTEREGTDDLQLKGYAKLQIDQYLGANPALASPDRLASHDLLAPVIDKGRITISLTHFQMYINKPGTQNFTVKAAVAMIMAVGGEEARFRRGRKDQSRWALPASEWDPEEYTVSYGGSTHAQ